MRIPTNLKNCGKFPSDLSGKNRRQHRAWFCFAFVLLTLVAAPPQSEAATHYVSLSGTHVPPFETWDQAATNIQDAIDVAVVGDEVLVTNGVYATGGKVMAGDLTNRIAIDKAITVRSVNGAQATEIWGAGSTNGLSAVRCAWLTNDAVLSGFTLSAGATRTSGTSDVIYGGAVWCSSTSAQIWSCRILNNSAYQAGGGVYRGSIRNSWLKGNRTTYVPGRGGGAHDSILNSCTVVENTSYLGGGVSGGMATNCIIYFNLMPAQGSSTNYFNGTILANSCTTPQPSGVGNIALNPLLASDRLHLKVASPCRGAGLQGAASNSDIDGRPWSNPPSMGCVEWQPEPAVYLPPTFQVVPGGKTLAWNLEIEGQPPFNCKWIKDGVVISEGGRYTHADTPNLEIVGFDVSDAGQYEVVVTNDFGVGASPVSPLVIHCVDQAAVNPVTPFTNWATASPIIQDAIDAANAREIVLVTNGLYASGGKVMAGNLTNRIALDKPLIVQSVNGPFVTTISGGSVTNGLTAVRCAWVTNGAMLSGFTLRAGATRSSGDFNVTYGGGVWCASNYPVVANCLITGNNADRGGGSFQGLLLNCAVSSNAAASDSGGCLQSSLNNSTVTWNKAKYTAGVGFSALTNCIIYTNTPTQQLGDQNYSLSTLSYSCSTPLPSGISNTAANPQFSWGGLTLFPAHLAEARGSRVRLAGSISMAGHGPIRHPWGALNSSRSRRSLSMLFNGSIHHWASAYPPRLKDRGR